MKPLKNIPTPEDRRNASLEAKKALLAKFKPREAAPDPNFRPPSEVRAEELAAVREARAKAKEEAAAAAEAARQEAERQKQEQYASEDARKRAERKERKAQVKAEARAKREASSAMRRRG